MIFKYVRVITLCMLLTISITATAGDLVITNAKIINPVGKIEVKLGYIVLHGDRIAKLGYGKANILKNTTTYDAQGQYIIPGLIDTHNHMDTILGVNEHQAEENPKFKTDYRHQLPRSYLYFGYTTIVDLATTDAEAIHDFNSTPAHPDLFTCGGGITVANGYPMSEFPQALRFSMFPNFLYDPNQADKLPSNVNPEEHTPTAIINRIVDAKAVCVKIFYETGFGADKNLPLPSLTDTKEVIRLAHQHQLPIIMHANSLSAQKFGLVAGTDMYAHGLWNWQAYNGSAGLPTPIKDVLQQIIDKKLGYQPTIQVVKGLEALVDPNYLNDPQLQNVVPKSLLDFYHSKAGEWYKNIILGNLTEEAFKKNIHLRVEQVNRVVNYLQKNHGNLLFGTDTPSGPTYGNPPGYNGYLEMQNWHDAGVSFPEILTAATLRNAKYFHLDKNYGSISVGKIANLIIMKKNPLSDITAYDSIATIILHGKPYKRTEFIANNAKKPTE